MSYIKDDLIKYQDRGYGHSTAYVCAYCFRDPFLQIYIRKHGNKGSCTYCRLASGRKANRNVMRLEEVMPVLMNAVNYYKIADDALPWDSEKNDYAIGKVIDAHTFVHEELNTYMGCENEELLNELTSMIEPMKRSSVYEFKDRQEVVDMAEWNRYCSLVRESKLSAEQIVSECYRNRASQSLVEIRECLEMVYSYVSVFRMISTISEDRPIYRCGTHIPENFVEEYDVPAIPATLVGTAPAIVTQDNRMSEKGDMMFYGAFQEEVALKEIEARKGKTLTTGIFHTNKRIRVLDLSTLYGFHKPSFFDTENSEKRRMWLFMEAFMREISQKVDSGLKAEGKGTEYKPTQVFTKFIQRRKNLAGIIYPSSKFYVGRRIYVNGYSREYGQEFSDTVEGKQCVVLFVTNRDCIEEEDKVDKKRVQLIMKANPKQRIL